MPKIVVDVCAGTHCIMMGAMDIIASIESLIEFTNLEEDCEIVINPVPCEGNCEQGQLAPIVAINGQSITRADSETVMSKILEIIRSHNCV